MIKRSSHWNIQETESWFLRAISVIPGEDADFLSPLPPSVPFHVKCGER
jgi:hypothetical protein